MICERCANAIWCEGDSSVGMGSYVEECKQKSRSIESIWEHIDNGESIICLFFIEQHDPEWSLIRCPECNSRKTNLERYGTYDQEGEFKCEICGTEFKHDMPY